MSTRGALAVIAAILLGLGLVLAFVPVSVGEDIACGSALSGTDGSQTSEAAIADVVDAFGDAVQNGSAYDNAGTHVAQCQDRVGSQRLVAFPIAAVGALGLVFLALTSIGKRVDEPVSEPLERSDP